VASGSDSGNVAEFCIPESCPMPDPVANVLPDFAHTRIGVSHKKSDCQQHPAYAYGV